jgi:hypothetical protein
MTVTIRYELSPSIIHRKSREAPEDVIVRLPLLRYCKNYARRAEKEAAPLEGRWPHRSFPYLGCYFSQLPHRAGSR